MPAMFQTRPGAQVLLGSGADDTSAPSLGPQRGMFAPWAPFASISASLISQLGRPGKTDANRTEPITGLEYPLEFCMKAKPCAQLAGLGVRSKKILGLKNIHVYGLGFYVDGTAAKKALGHKFKSADPKTLATNQALFDSLMSDNTIEKTLRMVITFGGLRRGQFLDAMEERLAPRLKKAGQLDAMTQFKHQFDDVTFRKGLEIVFTQSGKEFITKVGGVEVGRMTSPALSSAMWDIYLGTDPVSPDSKATLGSTLAAAIK